MNYAQWTIERKTCESCKHCLVSLEGEVTILRCDLWPALGRGKRRIYALYAREPGRCGIEATRWEENTRAAV